MTQEQAKELILSIDNLAHAIESIGADRGFHNWTIAESLEQIAMLMDKQVYPDKEKT